MGITIVAVVGKTVSVGVSVGIRMVGISVVSVVGISVSLSSGSGLRGSLGISGPLAVVIAMVGIGIAIVAVVGIAEVVAIAIVSIESIGISLSLGSDGCEHAESGNGHGFHDVIKLEELAGLPM